MRRDIDSSNKAFDPYCYSGGHWLHGDEQRQKARRLDFSFDALLDVALKHSKGAREVVACEEREGGFNRIFIIELDNGAKAVAKVPMRYAGPAALTTMSEVATLRCGIWHPATGESETHPDIFSGEVKSKTFVPFPRVLAWCSNRESSSVGAEYKFRI